MKICVVVNNSVWYDPRVRKQIESYIDAKFDVSVVGLNDSKKNDAEIDKITAKVTIVNIDLSLYKGKRSYLKIFKREWSVFKRIKDAIISQRPDIVHANDLNALIPAYYASKKIHSKIIYDSHEIWLENFSPSKAQKIFYAYFEKKIAPLVDKFVCVSHAMADYFEEKYNIDKPMVITNCVNTDCSINIEKAQTFEVLNHGQFYNGRGYDLILEAAKICNNSNITFVLRGYGSLEQSLREYVSTNKVRNVRFDPPVKVSELIKLAKQSHIGIAITEPTCLSFKLTVSNKLFEYAAAGLPVIMSDVPEHSFLNEKYHFGIILKDNSAVCLLEAVCKFFDDDDFYRICSSNSLKLSRELNWSNEFSKLISFENSLLSDK